MFKLIQNGFIFDDPIPVPECHAYCTELPNNNSGLDCVQMENGHLILVCNPIGLNWGARTPPIRFAFR